MNITRLAVRNPVGTILIVLVIFVLGFIAVFSLPTGYFPVFSIPATVIVTAYPGASALEVEQEITEPIEQTIASVTDISPTALIRSNSFRCGCYKLSPLIFYKNSATKSTKISLLLQFLPFVADSALSLFHFPSPPRSES